jgi:hypothetical protein
MKFLKRRNPPKFDSQAFHNEVASVAAQSPEQAAEVATHWKGKFMNAVMDAKQTTEKAIELGAALAGAGLIAYMQGGWEADAQVIISKWQTTDAAAKGMDPSKTDPFRDGGQEDPRQIFGLDIAFLYAVALAGISISGLAGEYGSFVGAAAIGASSYYVGKLAEESAFMSRTAALAQQAQTGTT